MPFQIKQRVSVKVGAIKREAQKEHRAAVRDIGRYVRDQARRNAKPGLRPYIVMGEVKETAQTVYVEVGSNSAIVRWNELGTGVWGPRKDFIRPKRARYLAWQVSGGKKGIVKIASGIAKSKRGKTIKSPKRDIYMVFARKVRGIKPRKFLDRAFHSTETQAFHRKRIREMNQKIKAAAK